MLIDVTCELLKTTQPAEITRALVARECGVDPSLIRYYFSNRSKLLLAAAQRLTERYGELLERAAARSDGTPVSLLCERIRALVDLIADYPYFHRLYTEEIMGSDDPDSRAIFRTVTQRGSNAYKSILKEGVRQGVLRDVDPTMLFTAIIGMSEFYGTGRPIITYSRRASEPELRTREAYVQFVCDMILNGIKKK
jgi:TetR/AcrR family transcriptional regulator